MKDIARIILILIIVLSCSPSKKVTYQVLYNSYAKYSTLTAIKIDTLLNTHERYIEFENKNSIIALSTITALNYAIKKLTDDSLCYQKKKDLESLITTIQNQNNGFYKIESAINPSTYKNLNYRNHRDYEKNFIKPYGYAIEIDSTNKIRLDILKDWMISDLAINGNCLVFDKRISTFTDTIYYVIADFKDGHGGESLVFKDKKPFFNVRVYSDILWPDFDCMSEDEMKYWNKK